MRPEIHVHAPNATILIARDDGGALIPSTLSEQLSDVAPTPYSMKAGPRFQRIDANGDPVLSGGVAVLDNETGLMWSRGNVLPDRVDHKAAVAACEKLKLASCEDWRLPTIRELLSIVDFERHEPAIDPAFECDAAAYWSASAAAWAPESGAWVVYFYGGRALDFLRDGSAFVRAVRCARVPAGQ